MATAEFRGVSSEQQSAYRQIAGFFGRAETEFPAAAGQLGPEGEKLRKAGKPEAEIFDEWLKQVFIPLYKRTKKKP